MGGGSSLIVYESNKAYPRKSEPGDGYDNQAEYMIECVKKGAKPKLETPAQARLAVANANAARRSHETGTVVAL